MPSPATALPITPDDRAVLRHWSSATQAPAALVQRAKLLLLAADGVPNTEIAERLGISRPTVIAWRKRYAREGLTTQLADRPRRGRPQTVRRSRRAQILATTLAPPPEYLGVTHWSTRLLGAELGWECQREVAPPRSLEVAPPMLLLRGPRCGLITLCGRRVGPVAGACR
jgi:transposase